MRHKIPGTALEQAPRPRLRPIHMILCAGLVVVPLVLFLLGVDGGLLRANNTAVTQLFRRVAPECHPQMLDQYWHLELGEVKDLCAKYDDLYGFNPILAGPSPYECRYTEGQDGSPPLPQFRVLGERHSGTNAITKLMYANFKGTLDTKTVNTDLSSHGPYSVRAPPVDMGITEHKHDEQTEYPGSDVDVPFIGLTVVAVRDPYKWIESMSYEIYGGQARNKFKVGQNETYSDAMERFLNTSWVGGDHVFNTSYEDIFDMRYRKVCNHIASALKYSQHVLFLRHEDDVSVTSKLSVVEAVSRLGWPLNADNGDVDLLLGKYYGHSEKNTNWGTGKGSSGENELIEAVNRHADWAFERVLGYLKQTPARVSSKPVTAASVPPRASVARAVVTPVPQPSPTPPEDTVKVAATPGPGANVAAGPLAR